MNHIGCGYKLAGLIHPQIVAQPLDGIPGTTFCGRRKRDGAVWLNNLTNKKGEAEEYHSLGPLGSTHMGQW